MVTLVPVGPVTQLQEVMPAASVRGAAPTGVQVTALPGEMLGPVVVWDSIRWTSGTKAQGTYEPAGEGLPCSL